MSRDITFSQRFVFLGSMLATFCALFGGLRLVAATAMPARDAFVFGVGVMVLMFGTGSLALRIRGSSTK